MDGRDENDMPIIEQVAEYLGKRLGDDIGGIIYQYANMYNEALVVLDATGGHADAAILTLMQMGYKNFYYEDNSQKTYMIQNPSKGYNASKMDQLPGFHFPGNRYPVLSNFATMVRMNELKIRSMRVINELETWIFKGEAQRIDHMDGAHDDTLTCLAMAMFVMTYSVNKMEDAKRKDTSILKAYFFQQNNSSKPSSIAYGETMRPKPFYTSRTLEKRPSNIQGTHLWVFGKMY